MIALDLLGAGSDVPDKATVQKFQSAIAALPVSRQEPEFVAMTRAVAAQSKASGVWGPTTKAAAKKFNQLYGWGDGAVISQGTLEALNRPDLKMSPADWDAKMNALNSQSSAASQQAAAANTPAEVQAAAQSTSAAAGQVAAAAPTPELKQEAAAAQNQAARATTPAEVQAAATQTEEVAKKVKAESRGAKSWLSQRTIISSVPNYVFAAGGGAVIAFLLHRFMRKAPVKVITDPARLLSSPRELVLR